MATIYPAIKQIRFLFILSFIAFALQPQAAHAQFWKKIFGKGGKTEKKAQKPTHSAPEIIEKKETKKRKTAPEFAHSVLKNRYRVDILIPLQLNTLVKDGKAIYKKQPYVVQPSIDFYKGLKMAAATLNHDGIKLDLYIHDISDPAHSIPRLSTDPNFRKTDLIIGLLQSNELSMVAALAKQNHINFLSALSPSDAGISNNPYFILIQPTLETHISSLVAYALDKYTYQPKFIFYDSHIPVQKEALALLKENLKDRKYKLLDATPGVINQDSLMQVFDKTSLNIVFINTFTQETTSSLLKSLASLSPAGYRFAVFGMPSMKSGDFFLDASAFPGLDIYFTSPFYYDVQSPAGKKIVSVYSQNYGGSPSEMAFRGYETLFWVSDLLKKYGNVFNKNMDDVSATPFTRYKISPAYNENNGFLYLENQKLYIFHYKNGNLNVE
jgi:ABC-type branched-subunit amino acid transport system substrate-binding protein